MVWLSLAFTLLVVCAPDTNLDRFICRLAAVNNMPDTVKYVDFVEEGKKLVTLLKEQGAELIICLSHMRKPNDMKYV